MQHTDKTYFECKMEIRTDEQLEIAKESEWETEKENEIS